MSDEFGDEVEGILDGSLTFSEKQIEYLQSEFERQRRWVKSLSDREAAALTELGKTRKSASYRLGRAITWPIRKIIRLLNDPTRKIFLWGTTVENYEQEIFTPFHISPETLPESGYHGNSHIFIQDMLLSIRIGALSVEEIKDEIAERSFEMENKELLNCLTKITKHVIRSREYHGTIKNLFVASFRTLVLKEPGLSLDYYDEFADRIKDTRAEKTYVQTIVKLGYIKKAERVIKGFPNSQWKRETLEGISEFSRLIDVGFSGDYYTRKNWESKSDSVLYFASQTMPYSVSGYAIRTHSIVKALKGSGFDIAVCARHGYPLDRADFDGEFLGDEFNIDGINYRFKPSNRSNGIPEIPYTEVFNFRRYEDFHYLSCETLAKQAKELRPRIIHAASNFVVGMAAVKTAKALEIPSIYEIRGFWHLTQASKRIGYEGSDHYVLSEALELETANQADHVFAITNAISDILVEYGIEREKITVLPNSVDVEKFHPRERDEELEDRFELYDKVVIGYIGSFVEYEGLDLLLMAISMIKEELGNIFRLLLVGDGPVMNDLREMVRFLALDEIVTITGRVPHDDVIRYYSVMDIMAFPRKGRRVCELVSPLKPFEAMSMEKAVVSSDVKALTEIVEHRKTGMIHKKDSAEDLAGCLKELVLDGDLRSKLSSSAREWVKKNRSASIISERVSEIYGKLGIEIQDKEGSFTRN